MKQKKSLYQRPLGQRMLSGFLAASLALGFFPAGQIRAAESQSGVASITEAMGEADQPVQHWAQGYLDQMVSYGFMRPEQAVDPDATLTRADFMSIINRAYGYHEMGENPYTDVNQHDWFYEDVLIATKVNYIAGTSPTTVEPHAPLTRETTAYILGVNMMLPNSNGENMVFTDTRDISDWARGMVKTASEQGLMVGYADGSFRPHNNITVGEIAALVLQAVGTPILEGGENEMGEIFGNVTITEPGTILKNTIIAGDLYISNGIGLGGVTLENVVVLGRIVVSGGMSEDGDASIVLRNVTADEMVVDNLRDQMVTIRVEGSTVISDTSVRQSTYLEDNTPAGMGLLNIDFDAEAGSELTLAGRVKKVTNNSSGTSLVVASGTVDELTIDEAATESTTEVLRGAVVTTLNLDTTTTVTGEGDVENANINAPDCVLTMLPDNIYIRPGLSANVAGEDIDSLTATEMSEDPRILSGYPQAQDISPSEFDAAFAVNKPGTLYWAVSTLTQGSVPEDELLKPPSYGGMALQSGNVEMPAANDEIIVHITDLEVGGDYYLSAVFVDGRGAVSTVKITAFSTPDNTIPAFNEGFPYLSQVLHTSAVATVMATKSCVLYWAVMPKGSVPPTGSEFLSNSLSGAAASGWRSLIKNTEASVNMSGLEEQKDYILYLWLTDANNANSSEVIELPFTTTDGTPPVFNQIPQTTDIEETSVGFNFSINEDGELFYVAVPAGTIYPKPEVGTNDITAPLGETYAKMQVAMGLNGGYGSVAGSVTAKGNEVTDFKISGLLEESAYDLYYVAKDLAGNYSAEVGKLTFNTLDNSPPEYLGMAFNKLSNVERPLESPYADTNITFTFSESIQSMHFTGSTGDSFIYLYNQVIGATNGSQEQADARETLGAALANSFIMYEVSDGTTKEVIVRNSDTETTDWVIDYRYAKVQQVDGQMQIIFPTVTPESTGNMSSLNMASGATYFFRLQNIQDASYSGNVMVPAYIDYTTQGFGDLIPQFTTVYATVTIGNRIPNDANMPYARNTTTGLATTTKVQPDAGFYVSPNSMAKISDDILYDILFDPDQVVAFNIYMRVTEVNVNGTRVPVAMVAGDNGFAKKPSESNPPAGVIANRTKIEEGNLVQDSNGWVFLSSSDIAGSVEKSIIWKDQESSLNIDFMGLTAGSFPKLNELDGEYQYEYVIQFTSFINNEMPDSWNGTLNMQVDMFGGESYDLGDVSDKGYEHSTNSHNVTQVSTPADYTIIKTFSDSQIPSFAGTSPNVKPDTYTAELTVSLAEDRTGTIYYLFVPVMNPVGFQPVHGEGSITQTGAAGVVGADVQFDDVVRADNQIDTARFNQLVVSYPINTSVMNANTANNQVAGSIRADSPASSYNVNIEGLLPDQEYYAIFVITGESGVPSPVEVFGFHTKEIELPIYTANNNAPTMNMATHVDSYTTWHYLNYNALSANLEVLKNTFSNAGGDDYVEFETEWAAWLAASKYTSLTILEAMSMKYEVTDPSSAAAVEDAVVGLSLFDIYASDRLKEDLAAAISNTITSSGSYGGSSYSPFEANKTYQGDIIEPSTGVQYIWVSTSYNAAHHGTTVAAADVNSFYAWIPFYVPDVHPPNVTTITGTVYETAPDDESNGSANVGRYDGALTITFDKTVYAKLQSTGENDVFVVRDNVATSNTAGGYISAYEESNWTGVNAGTPSTSGSSTTAKANITLNYTDARHGAVITLFSNYYIANESGTPKSSMLLLTFEETITKIETVTGGSDTGILGDTTTTVVTYERTGKWVPAWADGTPIPGY